jgi:hypothetical protein
VKVKSAVRGIALAAFGAVVLAAGSVAAPGIASASGAAIQPIATFKAGVATAGGLADGLDGLVHICAHGNYEAGIQFINSHGKEISYDDIPRGACTWLLPVPKGTAWDDIFGKYNTNNHWFYITKVRDSQSASPVEVTAGGTTVRRTHSAGPWDGVLAVCALGNYEANIQWLNSRGGFVSYSPIPRGQCGLYAIGTGTAWADIFGKYITNNDAFRITKVPASPSTRPTWIKADGTTTRPGCAIRYY